MHQSRLRVGQGLVGQIAETAEPINTRDASHTRGFRYLPETGEEVFSSFLGVPIQRLGEVLGVLVVQNREPREYTDDEVYALEVVAMVIAEMTELGAFVGPGAMEGAHRTSCRSSSRASSARKASPRARWCCTSRRSSSPTRSATIPSARPPRLHAGIEGAARRGRRDAGGRLPDSRRGEHRDVLKAYRMFAHDKGWVRRMEASIDIGPRRRGRGREGAVGDPRRG